MSELLVVKRDCSEQAFDESKIYNAIMKAMKNGSGIIKPKIAEIAKDKGIDIRLYDIIYKLVEEMESALKGKLAPEYEEKVLGEAELRKIFKFSKVGTIAGSYVTSGVIRRGSKARVIRDGVVINDSTIASLAREKDQAKEVKQGLECGITIENFNDIKEKDVIEAY